MPMTTTSPRDIGTMTSKQLLKLQAEISATLVRRTEQAVEDGKAAETRARNEVRAELAAMADRLGAQVARTFPKAAARPSNGHGAKAKPAKVAAKHNKVPIKYRDGDHAWSGRGKRPRWLIERVAAGANPEDFRVRPSA